MTDEQHKQLMDKLDEIQKAIEAGKWFPQPTYIPNHVPQPMYPRPVGPYDPYNPPPGWWHGQVTD